MTAPPPLKPEDVTLAEDGSVGVETVPRRTESRLRRLLRQRRRDARVEVKRSGLKQAVLVGPQGSVVCERCYVADRSAPRIRGLIGWRLDESEGMLLRPSWSIHTAFVGFPIDVVFLDEQLTIMSIAPRLKPWRVAWKLRAHAVLELPAGRCEQLGLARGDRFGWGWV